MRIRTAFAIISAITVSAVASAQTALPPALHIGDEAPALPVAGFVKGEKISTLEKGKTYVIEFWATWCGPCIASMPHLSDMADKFKDKISFVSVNTWDYRTNEPSVKEAADAHVTKVNEFVTKNSEKMRYNIVLDDQKDTISTNWMFAAGQYGIPCAIVVNEEGNIAWIGHPMQMEPVLDSVVAKTWDVAAYKAKFDPKIDEARESRLVQLKVSAALKANDTDALRKIIEAGKGDKFNEINLVITGVSRTNAKLGLELLQKYYSNEGANRSRAWSQIILNVSAGLKDIPAQVTLAKISEKNANRAAASESALIYSYHARVLNASGDKDGAMAWIEKAKSAVDAFEPAQQKESISKFIESTAKSFNKA